MFETQRTGREAKPLPFTEHSPMSTLLTPLWSKGLLYKSLAYIASILFQFILFNNSRVTHFHEKGVFFHKKFEYFKLKGKY